MRGVGLQQIKAKAEKLERDAKSLKNLVGKMDSSPDAPKPDLIQELIACYCEAWKDRYKTNPAMTGKSVGIFKTILKDFRAERAKALVQAYLKMSDSFFIKKRHDPSCLITNIQAVSHFADSAKVITSDDARETERAGKTKSLFDMVDQGKL